MDNLSDLKTIWLSAKTNSLPTSQEMVQLVKKFRNQKIRNKIVLIVSACLLTLVMLTIVLTFKSTFVTTRIGEIFITAACLILAVTNVNSIKRFYDLSDCSNKDFLAFIEQTRQNQIYYHNKTQFFGLLLCSAGLMLYLYEIVYHNMWVFIAVYTLAVGYLLFVWFVLRRRKFKKGIEQLNATRERIEKILNQLN